MTGSRAAGTSATAWLTRYRQSCFERRDTLLKGAPLEWVLSASLNFSRKEHPFMSSVKYIGMDVHKESISIAVMNSGFPSNEELARF